MITLSNKQIDILLHTSSNGRFVGDHDADMETLVSVGALRDYGPQTLADGAHYYVTTPTGRQILNEWHAAQPKPPVLPKRKQRAKERFDYWLNGPSINWSFGEWLKMGAPQS